MHAGVRIPPCPLSYESRDLNPYPFTRTTTSRLRVYHFAKPALYSTNRCLLALKGAYAVQSATSKPRRRDVMKVNSSSMVLLYAMIRKHTEESLKGKNAVFRVGGFEPPKCRDQNPMPYHLATPYAKKRFSLQGLCFSRVGKKYHTHT